MNELKSYIQRNVTNDIQNVESTILNMICTGDAPIELSQKSLLDALHVEGEFLVIKLHYSDFEDEIINQSIKYKISQSLSVVASYEDVGDSYDDIEKFIKYINANSDEKQNSTFGVKKVKKLSEFPITILCSGILPINQLKMSVGKSIYELINSDDEYYVPRFQKHRDDISKEIGIPILPVLPALDKELGSLEVKLVDSYDGRVISKFIVSQVLNKETVEIYLLKLFYIYKVLAEEKCQH